MRHYSGSINWQENKRQLIRIQIQNPYLKSQVYSQTKTRMIQIKNEEILKILICSIFNNSVILFNQAYSAISTKARTYSRTFFLIFQNRINFGTNRKIRNHTSTIKQEKRNKMLSLLSLEIILFLLVQAQIICFHLQALQILSEVSSEVTKNQQLLKILSHLPLKVNLTSNKSKKEIVLICRNNSRWWLIQQ